MIVRAGLLALAVTLAACGESATEPDLPDIGGPWEGPILTRSTIVLLLFDVEGAVSGSGWIDVPSGTDVNFSEVTGSHNYPNVNLTIRASGYQDIILTGTLSGAGTTITARLNGSGFTNDALTLTRS